MTMTITLRRLSRLQLTSRLLVASLFVFAMFGCFTVALIAAIHSWGIGPGVASIGGILIGGPSGILALAYVCGAILPRDEAWRP